MKLEDFIKDCFKDAKFRKYWVEDNLPIMEEVNKTFSATYD